MAAVVWGGRYVIGGACLLVAAGALRFYGLGASSLWHDEAIAAIIARGTLSEVVVNAGGHYSNTSPALYPMMLWAVQKVSSSEFSLRLMSASASLLTVGGLLFWMPRLGVSRGVAFMAGLLAALSVAGIEHARDAREYSVDALVALALVGGALQYLRDGRRALLCGALFVGPLLQYGLALFGAAALGAAALASVESLPKANWGGWRALGAALWDRMRGRVDLLLPAGCFAAGCALSWGLTARYQWIGGGWGRTRYLADFYYQSNPYDASSIPSILEFVCGQTWDMASYHMPAVVAAAGLFAFVVLMSGALRRDRFDAVVILSLACFAVGAAILGGFVGLYPFGGSRHNLYLGPIVFLAAGGALHWIAAEVGAAARRAWVGAALWALAAAGIAIAGALAVVGADAYRVDRGVERVMAALDERVREGDAVYVSRPRVPVFEFYKGGRPANYFYGRAVCWGPSNALWAECFPEILDEMFRVSANYGRIWFVHNASVSVAGEMAAHSPGVRVEEVDLGGGDALRDRKTDVWVWPQATLQLITGFEELAAGIRGEWLGVYADVVSDAPSAAGEYDLYLREDALYYAKRPCVVGDTEARFFLHLYPEDADDLPDWRRQYGFDNLDFAFQDYGLLAGDRCVIRRELPGYAIERIRAGQFAAPNGPRVWEVELAVNP